MDQSYFLLKKFLKWKTANLRGISMLLTPRFALTLCFLRSPPCKPYSESSKHREYREKKGSLKLDTCFKTWYFLYRKTDLHQIWTMKDEFIIAGYISSAECLPDQCLFWAGERPIEISLFALPTCLLTRVEHRNKQVPACWHYNKLKNTHLTLVLSKKLQLCLPQFRVQCCGVKWLSGTKIWNETRPETWIQGGKCEDI